MGRPRIHSKHLPPYVYQKHGAYYFIRGGKWMRLGATLQESLSAYASICEPSALVPPDAKRLRQVYVINARNLIKIGIAVDLSARVRSLRTGNPHLGTVVYSTDPLAAARRIELAAHQALESHRVEGEWFRCTTKLAIETVKRCVEAHSE